MILRKAWAAVVLLAVAPCCASRPDSGPSAANDDALGGPTDLTATLVDAVTIELRWKARSTREAGYFVEGYFESPGATREFLRIDTVPAGTTVYRHEKLMPRTTFFYRVRAFFGRTSNETYVVTGPKGAAQLSVPFPPRPRPAAPTADQKSLRRTEAEAAPRELRATLLPPVGVKLEWKDAARDEEEYLVEIRSEGADALDYRPSASLEPDTTSMVSYNFPPESRIWFRVRAIVSSAPSNVVHKTTEGDPDANRLGPLPRAAGH
jgi:hypothetical protein